MECDDIADGAADNAWMHRAGTGGMVSAMISDALRRCGSEPMFMGFFKIEAEAIPF